MRSTAASSATGGYLGLHCDRWSTFVDAFGGYAEVAASETIPTRFCTVSVAGKAELREAIVDFAVGYRLGQWSLPTIERPLSLGVIGGLQRAGAVSDTFNWADPMIGVRWVALDLRGRGA